MKLNLFARRFRLDLPLVLAATFMLAACGDPASEPPQSLEERVEARWHYIIERDFDAAWAFYSPGFRDTNPRPEFIDDMARLRVNYTDAVFQGAHCEGDRCDVRVGVTYQLIGGRRGLGDMQVPSTVEERWIFLGGQWWFTD